MSGDRGGPPAHGLCLIHFVLARMRRPYRGGVLRVDIRYLEAALAPVGVAFASAQIARSASSPATRHGCRPTDRIIRRLRDRCSMDISYRRCFGTLPPGGHRVAPMVADQLRWPECPSLPRRLHAIPVSCGCKMNGRPLSVRGSRCWRLCPANRRIRRALRSNRPCQSQSMIWSGRQMSP